MRYCRAENNREKAAKRESSRRLEQASAGRQRHTVNLRSGVQTAVDIQTGAGNLPRSRAGEEGDCRCDILRLAVMARGNKLTLRVSLLAVFRVHIAVGRAGVDPG